MWCRCVSRWRWKTSLDHFRFAGNAFGGDCGSKRKARIGRACRAENQKEPGGGCRAENAGGRRRMQLVVGVEREGQPRVGHADGFGGRDAVTDRPNPDRRVALLASWQASPGWPPPGSIGQLEKRDALRHLTKDPVRGCLVMQVATVAVWRLPAGNHRRSSGIGSQLSADTKNYGVFLNWRQTPHDAHPKLLDSGHLEDARSSPRDPPLFFSSRCESSAREHLPRSVETAGKAIWRSP